MQVRQRQFAERPKHLLSTILASCHALWLGQVIPVTCHIYLSAEHVCSLSDMDPARPDCQI